MIPVFKPFVHPDAVRRVVDTLEAGQLSEGAAAAEFERALEVKFRFPHAAATNSGTAALHLALDVLGVGPGDTVAVPAQTFIASAMVPLLLGARVVFVDIDRTTGNIDPSSLAAAAARSNLKAAVVVHYGGVPADMDTLSAVGVPLVEDCAHALGAAYKGAPVGTIGAFGAFSFQAIKQLTTGDGGLLVCRSASDHKAVRRRRWFGIDRTTKAPAEERGWKYHMNDVAASMGLGQLPHFDTWQAARARIDRWYRQSFRGLSGLTLLSDIGGSARWLFTVLVERRDDFVRALRDRGVEAAVWHGRIDQHPIFDSHTELPNADYFNRHQAILPLRPNLEAWEADRVIDCVKRGW